MDIDKFEIGTTNKIVLLTHVHQDHCVIPKKFTGIIYCSPITAHLMQKIDKIHIFSPKLIINQWIKLDDMDAYCFSTNHGIGAVGVFVPSLCLLHYGDGRPNQQCVKELKTVLNPVCPNLTIIGDDFFKAFIACVKKYPSVVESCIMLKKVIKEHYSNEVIWIKIASFSCLEVLPLNPKWRYKFKKCGNAIADTICEEAFKLLGLDDCNQSAKKIYVSRDLPTVRCHMSSKKKFLIVRMSARFWFIQKYDKFIPVRISNDEIRCFVCFHASEHECNLLQSIRE